MLTATAVLFHTLLASEKLERKNFIVLMVGLAAPWLSNFFYLIGVEPFRHLDLTPLAFAISGAAFFLGVLRNQILELAPIARYSVIENIQDAVFVMNLKNQVVDLNGAARRLLPVQMTVIVGKKMADLLPELNELIGKNRTDGMDKAEIAITSDGTVRLWRVRHSALTSGGKNPCGWLLTLQDTGSGRMLGKTTEIQCIRKDGDRFPAELSLSPMRLNDQWHAVGIVRDISERKKTQEFLLQSEKMLSVGGLAAGMAHEINNPLAGILASIQMIRMRLLSDLPANQEAAGACGLDLKKLWVYLGKRGVMEMVNAADQSCQRAASIVNNMLSFSRKSDTAFSDHDLAQLLEQPWLWPIAIST